MATIRPYREGDEAGVGALLEDSAPGIYRWKMQSLHGPDRDEPSRRRTQVALGPDGGVRGAVTLAHHSIHRGQYTLVVQVAPEHRRQGLGRELAAAGRRMRTEPLPMIAQYMGSDAASAGLVRALGGEIVQTTPGYRFDPAELRVWADAQPVPPGAVVRDLTGVSRADLTAALVEQYVWVHEGWTAPPLSVPLLTPRMATYVAGTRAEVSAGAFVAGRLAAFAAVVVDPGGTAEVVAETVRRDEPDGTALVAAALADSLRRSADAGIRAVELDGHVTDPHLQPVTQTFPPGVATDPLRVARFD